MSFVDEARARVPEMPYNNKKQWLAERLDGFMVALRAPEISASAIAALLADKGYVIPYRTVKAWCDQEEPRG